MTRSQPLHEIQIDGQSMSELPWIEVYCEKDEKGNKAFPYIMFYKDNGNNVCQFYFLEVVAESETEMMGVPFAYDVDVIFSGEITHDGIKHVWFGDEATENQGYLFYPNFLAITEGFKTVCKLAEKLNSIDND